MLLIIHFFVDFFFLLVIYFEIFSSCNLNDLASLLRPQVNCRDVDQT